MTKFKKIILAAAGIAIFLLIIFVNKNVSLEPLRHLNFLTVALAWILMYVAITLAATRWGLIINALEGKKAVPFRKYWFYFSLSTLLGTFGLQEISIFSAQTGSLLLEKIGLHKIFNVYLIDKIINLINLVSVAWIAILYYLGWIKLNLAVGLLVTSFVTIYFVISHPKINFTLIIFYLNKFLVLISRYLPFFKKFSAKISAQNQQLILPPATIRKLYFLSIIKFLSLGSVIFLIFTALQLKINFFQVILAFSITELSIFFAFTPGGLGILETGWFILLKVLDFSPADINTFIISYRVFSYSAISTIVAVNYLLFLTVKKK